MISLWRVKLTHERPAPLGRGIVSEGLDHSDRRVDCDAATRVSNALYHLAVVASDVLLDSGISVNGPSLGRGRLFPRRTSNHSSVSDSPDMLNGGNTGLLGYWVGVSHGFLSLRVSLWNTASSSCAPPNSMAPAMLLSCESLSTPLRRAVIRDTALCLHLCVRPRTRIQITVATCCKTARKPLTMTRSVVQSTPRAHNAALPRRPE